MGILERNGKKRMNGEFGKEKEDSLLNSAIDMMAANYYRIACINLQDNEMKIIKIAQDEEGDVRDYSAFIRKFAQDYVLETYRERFLNIMKPDRLMKIFDTGQNYLNFVYQRYEQGMAVWVESELIPMPGYSAGDCRIMWYVKNISENKAKKEGTENEFVRVNTDMNLSHEIAQDDFANSFKISRDDISILNHIIGSLSSGILAYKLPNREIITLNQEAKRLLDWEERDMSKPFDIRKISNEKIFREDFQALDQATERLKNVGDSAVYEFRIRHERGVFLKIRVNSRLLQFVDGSRYILSTMSDVTEESMLIETIQDERKRYRDALTANCEYAFSIDFTDDIIWERDMAEQGKNLFKVLGIHDFVSCEKMLELWIRIRKPRFLNENAVRYISRMALLDKYRQGEKNVEAEYYNTLTDRYTRIACLMSENSRNGHVMGYVIGTDTTESRRKEERTKQALREAYEAAKQANSAKSDFLSRMSHDIRTPMNAIIGMTAIAGTHLDEKERVADCLNKITVASSHLLSLVNEVLDMAKIESGKVDLNEKEFNLCELVDNLISMSNPQIKAKNQEFYVHIEHVLHERVIGDELRIQQSFVNLLGNAVKYTPPGGRIDLYVSEKPSHQSKVGNFEFIFKDTGIGMKPEFIEHIFEPFSRATDSRISKIQGTGLGLAITSNLVHMMSGDIKVESKPGIGSKFTVTMSLKLQDAENVSCEAFAGLPILIVDDDISTCESANDILIDLGMESEWTIDGEMALKKIEERHKQQKDYFAVILDWKMPDMNGIEITRRIRELIGLDVTTIIVSAFDWSDIELEARTAGADAFVSKPLFKSRLVNVFHELIEGTPEKSVENELQDVTDADFSGNRILLAEDNDFNAEITIELLGMMGIEVVRAENGQEVVDIFQESEEGYYQLIFMDIQMPLLNGNDAARAIRALPRKDARRIPIAAMTANAFADDVQTSMNAGMNEHISKPLDFKKLVRILEKWLPDKKEEGESK